MFGGDQDGGREGEGAGIVVVISVEEDKGDFF
jgi:hypothetical protein